MLEKGTRVWVTDGIMYCWTMHRQMLEHTNTSTARLNRNVPRILLTTEIILEENNIAKAKAELQNPGILESRIPEF